MQPSKTKSQFNALFMAGYFFILALVCISLSLIFFEEMNLVYRIVLFVMIGYFLTLIFVKYRDNLLISIIILSLFSLLCSYTNQNNEIKIRENPVCTIYPDQVKIKDNWLSGIAHCNGHKVLLSGKVDSVQKQIFKSGKMLRIRCQNAEISEITPATNFGEFDYRHYYHSRGIFQKIKANQFIILKTRANFLGKIHQIRFCLKKYFSQMPKLLGFFSSELLLAENGLEDKEIIDNYKTLGIIHLLSISGLHVGIYTRILSTILYHAKIEDQKVVVACVGALLIGIFLSNFQAGFVRASVTYALSKIFSLKKIKISGLDLLGVTCLLHLLIIPRLFGGIGAILSYVLALGLQVTNQYSKMLQSCFLNLLLTPFLLISYSQTNLLTLLFNLVAVPYFNFVVIPLTFINIILFRISHGFADICERILEFTEGLISFLSKKELGLFIFGKINLLECVIIFILTLIIIGIYYENNYSKRTKKLFIFALSLTYLLVFCRIHCPLTGQVTFIDVGQGDSILITTPFPRKVYLIDTGGKLNFLHKKITPQVNRITIPLLHAQGIDKIDGLFVSHQDADHVGDLKPLIEQIYVKKLYMAKGLINNPSFRKRLQTNIRHTQLVELLAGMQVREKKINFEVVYPFKQGTGKNEDSLSLSFLLNGYRWLFTGDLGQDGEKEILQNFPLKVDYFKLGHHGSKTSSNFDFLKSINPKMVFISAGRNNRFGHPHQETLDTLQKLDIPWASTQDCGMISWYYGMGRPHFDRFVRKEIK